MTHHIFFQAKQRKPQLRISQLTRKAIEWSSHSQQQQRWLQQEVQQQRWLQQEVQQQRRLQQQRWLQQEVQQQQQRRLQQGVQWRRIATRQRPRNVATSHRRKRLLRGSHQPQVHRRPVALRRTPSFRRLLLRRSAEACTGKCLLKVLTLNVITNV